MLPSTKPVPTPMRMPLGEWTIYEQEQKQKPLAEMRQKAKEMTNACFISLLHHQLHRRTRSLRRHLFDRHIDGTKVSIHVDVVIQVQADILDHNCRQVGAVAVVIGVKDDCAAAAALLRASLWPATSALVGGDRDGCSGVDGTERLRLGRLICLQH